MQRTSPVRTPGDPAGLLIGGAVLPPIADQIADRAAMLNPVFQVPLIGYQLLVGFALATSRARVRTAAASEAPGSH